MSIALASPSTRSTRPALVRRQLVEEGVRLLVELRPHDRAHASPRIALHDLGADRSGQKRRKTREKDDLVGGHGPEQLRATAREGRRRAIEARRRPRAAARAAHRAYGAQRIPSFDAVAPPEPHGLARVRAGPPGGAVLYGRFVALRLVSRIARAARQRRRDARADGCAGARALVAREARHAAVDAHLVTVEASHGDVPVASCGPRDARRSAGGAARRPIPGDRALEAEGRAVEARQLALLAVQEVRARRRTPGLVAFCDAAARSERAGRLPADDDALLAAPRAIAHGERLVMPAGESAAGVVAEADEPLLAPPAACVGARAPQGAGAEAGARVRLEPALAQRQREVDRGRRAHFVRHLLHARAEIVGDERARDWQLVARRQQRAHALDRAQIRGNDLAAEPVRRGGGSHAGVARGRRQRSRGEGRRCRQGPARGRRPRRAQGARGSGRSAPRRVRACDRDPRDNRQCPARARDFARRTSHRFRRRTRTHPSTAPSSHSRRTPWRPLP